MLYNRPQKGARSVNFGFTEEQELLRREARKLLDERCPLEEVRKLAETPIGYAEELWRDLGALGWTGLTIPETYGGAGLGWVDLVVLLEETGRSLFPSPLISTTLAASALLDAGSEEQRARLLPRLADGSRIGTLALFDSSDEQEPSAITIAGRRSDAGYELSGTKCFVADPDAADLFVVAFRSGEAADDLCLALVERESAGVSSQSFPTLDRTKRMGNLVLDGVRVATEDGLDVYQALFLRACGMIVILAAASRVRGERFDRRCVTRPLVLRIAAEVVVAATFFAAIVHLEFANAQTILMVVPFAVIVVAARLGEHVTRRRYVLVVIGFAGVIAVVRPTPEGFSPWALLVIAAAAALIVREFATQRVDANTPPLPIALLTAVAITTIMGAISVVTG